MLERNVAEVGRFEAHKLPNGDTVYFDPKPAHAYYGAVKPNPRAEGGYSAVADSRLVGCSTVAKALDGDADPLIHWGSRIDRKGIAELASRSLDAEEIGGLQWLRTPEGIREQLEVTEKSWVQNRQARADEGESVHEDIFLALATGRRPPTLANLTDSARGYGQASFAWYRDRSPTPLYAEQVTSCASLRVGGRFDLFACDLADHPGLRSLPKDARVLVDAKTREKGKVRRADHVQLPGYDLCNDECGIGRADALLVLILMPDGTYREEWCVGTEDDFLAALSAHRRGNDLERRMRAGEEPLATIGEPMAPEVVDEVEDAPAPGAVELADLLARRSGLQERRQRCDRILMALGVPPAQRLSELQACSNGRALDHLLHRLEDAAKRRGVEVDG